jgi:tetratricopeptide (TPR) repeat protein
METLYDLLGALPRDDAEELRVAFRRAVKGAHPDLNPGDPDAGQKFRQIVRANEILTDEDQRAAYDHLLDLAHKEHRQKVHAKTMHSVATSVIALVAAAGVSVSSYLAFLHEPAIADTLKHVANIATVRPADFAGLTLEADAKPQPIATIEVKPEIVPLPPQEAEAPLPPPEPQAVEKQAVEKAEIDANVSSDVAVPVAVTPPSESDSTMASVGPPLDLLPSDARVYRERGVSAYHGGDFDAAMADFDRAIQLDPKFSAAYIDRGILLYRLQKFERAFADIAHAKRIERAKNAKAESIKAESAKVAKKPKPQAAMVQGVPPLFQRHTAKLE